MESETDNLPLHHHPHLHQKPETEDRKSERTRLNPVFVLGMPRCRTAWLSICLSSLGCDVTHEGLRDHDSFVSWADELDARLELGPAGDSDPGLVYWIDELLKRWPKARFVVITRKADECMNALASAAPHAAGGVRMGWSGFLTAFKGACDRLRERVREHPTSNTQRPTSNVSGSTRFEDGEFRGAPLSAPADWTLDVGCSMLGVQRNAAPLSRFWTYESLRSDNAVLDIMEFATGRRPGALWVRRMQRLRVTSTIVPVECAAKPAPAEPIRVPSLEGFNTEGLSATLYANADYEMVARWWQQHLGQPLREAALPPFGVIVRDAEGPAAALWGYECYGVPVAELAFPVTRPGLSLKKASAALCYAVAACIAAIGKGHVPEASFRFFKTFAPRGMVRYLKRLGFEDAMTERVAMTLAI
jgi:hypothetical protein